MNKWLLAVGLWFIVAGSAGAFDACAKNYQPIASRYKTGLKFVVQKCGGKPSFIVGTMHSDDPKIILMHKNIIPVLRAAKNALFEVKFDDAAVQTTLNTMFYAPQSGKNLRADVGGDLYNRFIKVAKPDARNNYFKPWSAAVSLQYPSDVADGKPLDMKLQELARANKVNVVGLETADEQLSIFDSLPKADQIQMLKDVLDNFDQNAALQQKLMDAYLAKDLVALQALIPASIALSSDKQKAQDLMVLLIDQRNIKMVQRMQKYLESGSAFVAIGALHLPTDKGVLKLLEDKGYKIEVY